jgi:integration host factor subunit alpha
MSEHELEQMRLALAQTLFDEIDLNLREALELADQFYGEIGTSLESGDDDELADSGNFSLRGEFPRSNMYGSGRF